MTKLYVILIKLIIVNKIIDTYVKYLTYIFLFIFKKEIRLNKNLKIKKN